ncbi:haloacid dehalogenase [Salinibacterium xinjiangense]|uniref:Haloacid dehalogenase superfamily, subfamily IA, variant 3 with third motif having DD or ED n=1 Tax=Salinibacterium xinjiangense TaxID=386302 RepID=A0A2C8ZTI6_9MICO|nr:HAD family phosphatase [Salinibacterium xinjiangense]GGL06697.1 haloacid dehalogenase [Salinibacterium xinjiangense]SOE68944.1 haloacid dehalogenase superfamily, subfamily IA, variant 3 with third motif having DD or ED [Salinibacterium xinjiangense]
MTHSAPAAVLWDMDGTLVNTEPYWIAAETELIEAFGGSWSHEEALQLIGSGLWRSAQIMQTKGVALTEVEIIDNLTDKVIEQLVEFGIPWRPGARELLMELREARIPTALVTMSVGRMAHHVADRLGFVGFDAVVSGDDVTNSKPHPEAYHRGAELLGVDITQCLAIEDSPPGIASASAAGAVVIGVPFMVELIDSPADVLWPTLDGRTVSDLSAAFLIEGAR